MKTQLLSDTRGGNILFIGVIGAMLSCAGWVVLAREGKVYCWDVPSHLATGLANKLDRPVIVTSISNDGIEHETFKPNPYDAGCKGDGNLNDYALVSIRNIGDHISHIPAQFNR